MGKYRYILFDLDGTLVYSHRGIYECIAIALQQMGKPLPTAEQLARCIGPTLMYSFQNYFGLNEEDAWEATGRYRAVYPERGMYNCQVIEGMVACVEALKGVGYRLAVATSKPETFAKKIAERFEFAGYFEEIVGCGLDGSLNTKASVIEEALKRLGASADECLMVGDRHHDVEGARENGMDVALLKVGYAENEEEYEWSKPDYIFDNFEKLQAFLTEKTK
ncbi:MAG: HAD hydrolase-like protein [Clostridia bacterium]|nr:HAD hydrolase-like protein [Clostridia bacterium]